MVVKRHEITHQRRYRMASPFSRPSPFVAALYRGTQSRCRMVKILCKPWHFRQIPPPLSAHREKGRG